MQKLFKVERYAFDFVLADNSSQAKDFDFDNSDPTKTVTEITEMSPEREAFKRNPYDLKPAFGLTKPAGSGFSVLLQTVLEKRKVSNLQGPPCLNFLQQKGPQS